MFIRSGQNHLARHSERGKRARQTGEEVGIQIKEWTGLDFSGEQGKMEETGSEIIYGAPMTLAVKK